MKNQNFEELLAEYRKNNPTSQQILGWKTAVKREVLTNSKFKKKIWLQMVAASMAGFLIGAFVFRPNQRHEELQNNTQNDNEVATVEYVITKTN